tara:strand:+ start:414 stop:785 length:372 start_codon:yes stop_codon:yes gene_type:complete
MSIRYTNDLTLEYKQNVYHIELDVSGWDTVTFQAVAPVASAIFIYGSLDNGMSTGQSIPAGNYGAQLAINWTGVQAVNLATGSAVSSISAAGNYSVPVNTQFLKLQGGGADVYRLIQFNSKLG